MKDMKFIYKRDAYEDLQNDLNMVQDTLNSGYFMIIDLFFWALFLYCSFHRQHNTRLKWLSSFFISFYVSGLLSVYVVEEIV